MDADPWPRAREVEAIELTQMGPPASEQIGRTGDFAVVKWSNRQVIRMSRPSYPFLCNGRSLRMRVDGPPAGK